MLSGICFKFGLEGRFQYFFCPAVNISEILFSKINFIHVPLWFVVWCYDNISDL